MRRDYATSVRSRQVLSFIHFISPLPLPLHRRDSYHWLLRTFLSRFQERCMRRWGWGVILPTDRHFICEEKEGVEQMIKPETQDLHTTVLQVSRNRTLTLRCRTPTAGEMAVCSRGPVIGLLLFFVVLLLSPVQGLSISKDENEQPREAKFINFKSLSSSLRSDSSNEIDSDVTTLKSSDDDAVTADDPTSVLSEVYTDCISEFSFACVQRKVLVFFDRLGRMESFSVLGDFLKVVRTRKDNTPAITEEGLMARLSTGSARNSESDMDTLIDLVSDKFFNNHVLRVQLPTWTEASVPTDAGEARVGTTVDISLGNGYDEEGRGKKKKGKGMKKMMGMMCMMMMGKMLMMGKAMLLLIKIKAIKALIIGSIALLLSKIQLIKKLIMKKGGGDDEKHIIVVQADHGGGHGGGHDSYGPPSGGGGGSWSGGGGGHGGGGDSYGPPSGGGGGGWSGGGGGGGWNRRSVRSTEFDPHWLAYRGHIVDKTW